MKNTLLVISLSLLLLLGCVDLSGGQAGTAPPEDSSGSDAVAEEPSGEEVQEVQPEEQCDVSYAFSKLSVGTLSKASPFAVTATCADGKKIGVYLNGKLVVEKTVSSNDPEVLEFSLPGKSDGANDLVVKSGSETIHSETWTVLPLGSKDISGKEYDQVSNKKWVAIAFDIDGLTEVRSIGAYMKRLEYHTLQDSYMVAEIRGNSNNNPSDDVIASKILPITDATMSDNWIYFNLVTPAKLDSGRYWAVFTVSKEEPTIVGDTINIHYVSGGNTIPSDGTTKKMSLSWSDSSRTWKETSWVDSSFQKTYSVFLSSGTR